ncbi:unnamed protein product [Paramecium octaurelia]|uniref:Kinesin-like protein n=1 Tax=Paramecium octaurelia TaxID=43137 RepID=A0A8S1S681_PAROT|nr:unnamed protein product [Paramecium octaurelia]
MNTSFPKMSTSSLSQTTSQTNFYDSSPMSSYSAKQLTSNDNFKVVVRVRPPLQREVIDGRFISTIQVSPDHKKICLYEYYNIDLVDPEHLEEYLNNPNSYTMHTFSFDYVYDQDNTQEEVYDNTARHAVLSALQGFNATIMAYGQTGTGKTYTMEGFKYNCIDPQRGIIPRAIEEIFKHISNGSNESTTFMVRVSYLQIYNEVISDLLRSDRQNLHIREDKKRGVFVEGLSEWAVRNPSEIYSLIQKGAQSRATASTKMNDVSSRSHAVFIIIVEQMTEIDNHKSIKVGKLNLVDLAGSERVRVTGATGRRLEESKKINQSLSCLGNVISALIEQKTHIPYRDSKITRLLEDSLGGNCKTTMMGMISPAIDAFLETLSSVKFANRAKNIKNKATINEDVDQKALLRKYECELQRLRKELSEKNKTIVDSSKLSQLEEDKKRAEQDKNAAMAALEARSKQFFIEREEKKKLEEKIRQINSQMLIGGCNIENSPQFRNAIEEQQKLIRAQYEKKITELEKERSQLEEDKVQVDRYKQLTLKQRDIMIALTTRLNERDETIVQLQDELDAYDRIHRETETMLDQKIQRVQQLEEYVNSMGGNLPNVQQIQSIRQSKIKDCVTQDGQETYNITKENLQDYESQIEQLTLINQEQDQEISRLNNLLLNHENSNLMEYVKSSVDNIIDALSQPNDGLKLQSVAKDLISLQKILSGEQQQSSHAFSNIQNIVHSRKESPMHTNQSKKSLNNSQNYDDDEQPRQLNNFYTFSNKSQTSSMKKQKDPSLPKPQINVQEIIKMREVKRNLYS